MTGFPLTNENSRSHALNTEAWTLRYRDPARASFLAQEAYREALAGGDEVEVISALFTLAQNAFYHSCVVRCCLGLR